ncbi:SDR family NAD(P)-dependent oxidoreductase [Paraferrimonas sp. SM1919]|uniref:SDR family NAD(P)-dependent oxidoreductase n=1 Tax=Paraferrimonas sp. SM1919 TaxID=2662263 RepID=UPI0013CF9717|nr:SDR family oxidoreductase [Paraferrimonas sp. SM1919]
MDKLLDFDGQRVFISGAVGGFGLGLCHGFAQRRANLFITDIDSDKLTSVSAELTKIYPMIKVESLAGDISVESFHADLVETIRTRLGGVDIAINNAGIAQPPQAFHQQNLATFQAQLDINLTAVFLAMRSQLTMMKAQGCGHIVNISSVAATEAAPAMAGYSAAKHGVLGLTRTAAYDYANMGIRVNAVCPFLAATNLLKQIGKEGANTAIEAMSAKHPMGRIALVEEVVNAILLLCSPANTFTNGQAIVVDGGISVY